MIYLVSGWKETGTIKMMEALVAGGMEAAWDKEKDDKINASVEKNTGHRPKNAYYTFEREKYYRPGFPEAHDGKLIQVLAGGLSRLSKRCTYKTIYMRRPQTEVVKAIKKRWGEKSIGNAGRPDFVAKQEKAVEWIKDNFESCEEIWYAQMYDEPLKVFQALKKDGWPIDVAKAAAIFLKPKEAAA